MSVKLRSMLLLMAAALSGCALPVRQIALSAPLVPASGHTFVLAKDVHCSIGTGYGRTLRAGTPVSKVTQLQLTSHKEYQ